MLIESRNEKTQRVKKFQAAMDSDEEGVEKLGDDAMKQFPSYFFANACIYKSAMNTRTVVIG